MEAAAYLPGIDPHRIIVHGQSQGGGTAIAAAALNPRVAAALPDVPYGCDFPRAVGFTADSPTNEIVTYLAAHRDAVDATFRTLAYHDGALLARRASAPALFSTALHDTVCPPSTVFAARNAWGLNLPEADRPALPQIRVYPIQRARRRRRPPVARASRLAQ